MIAMTDSIFVCNECVDLLHNIAQKKEREDPVRTRKREIKLEELNRIHADLSALRVDVNRRLDWIESRIKLLTRGFGI
jgi:ATP-dependent protease Clp ATPase subunit